MASGVGLLALAAGVGWLLAGGATAAPSLTSSSRGLGQPVIRRIYSGRDPNGYTVRLTLSIYAIHKASSIPPLPFSRRAAVAACTVNRQTDAVIPVATTITNTTKGFSAPFSFDIASGAYNMNSNQGQGVEADLTYGGSSKSCANNLDATSGHLVSVNWTSGVRPGVTVSYDFFFVAHGYYSPRYPRGVPGYFKGFRLNPQVWIGPQGNQSPVLFNKSGITPIPLAPGR